MAGVNKVILIGRLGKDPELRQTGGGMSVGNMSVATSNKFKKADEWVEETEWHRVVLWGKTAENCSEYLSKGREVYIEGRLQTREWEKDGVKRYTTEVVAQTVQFLGGGQSSEGGQQGGASAPQSGASAPQSGTDDDDIPF